MAKHLVNVFKSGDKIYIKGERLLITLPLDTEKVLAVYYGDKVQTELDITVDLEPE